MIRHGLAQRLTSAVVGGAVTALGGLTIAALSGRDLDLELIWIVALATVGVWLLATALVASAKSRARNKASFERLSSDDADAEVLMEDLGAKPVKG